MQRGMGIQLVTAAALVMLFCSCASAARDEADFVEGLPTISFFHRFSEKMREVAEKTGAEWDFPALNTADYHKLLVHRDFVRHGRKLAGSTTTPLTFDLGNLTYISPDMLHYAEIDIGTPAVSHFVALDSGSDLFWLPCECKACAPASAPAFEGPPDLNQYTPSKSTTAKPVTCSSSDCSIQFSTCTQQKIPSTGQCTYLADYGFGPANASSSGILFQDDVHLIPNSGAAKAISTPIVLGCGQTQGGSLVDGSNAPDGLLGLGRQPFSLPSVLASSGLVGNSFSLCFSADLSGRIVFGDYGSSNLTTVPFATSKTQYLTYPVTLSSITVGSDSVPVNALILFDTGTTVTFLETTVYKAVIASFEKQTTLPKTNFGPPFEACYATSDANVNVVSVEFNFPGNVTFNVLSDLEPYYYENNNSLAGFCLGILDGGTSNIFAVNFMLGYKLVFNRDSSTLGFEQSTCYNNDVSGTAPSGTAPSPVLPPGLAPVASGPASAPPVSAGAIPPVAGGGPIAPSPNVKGGTNRISVPLLSSICLGLIIHSFLY